MTKNNAIVLAIILTLPALLAIAQEKKSAKQATPSATAAPTMLAPAEMQWRAAPPGLPTGAEMVVLDGNPAEKGFFTVRLKTPAGYRIPPHTHPTAERVTVISGTVRLGIGEKFDEAAAREFGPGSFAVLPPGVPHYAYMPVETVLQIHSEGPFERKPVDANNQ